MRGALVVLGFLGAGLVGALAGHVLFPPEEPPPADPGRLARLEDRLSELVRDVARLDAELRRERTAPPLPGASHPPAAGSGEKDDTVPGGGPEASGRGPDASPLAPALIPADEIEEKVRETIEEVAREQREERERQAEAKQVAREVAWLEKIRGPLRLTDLQVEEILRMMRERRVITARYKAERAALGPEPDPRDVELLSQRYADIGGAREAELRALLSPAQFDGLMEAARQEQGRGK